MRAKALVLEELEDNAEIQEEIGAATVRCEGAVGCEAHRLTFFRSESKTNTVADLDPDEILGSAVVLKLTLPNKKQKCFVLESVVCPPHIILPSVDGSTPTAPVGNYYVHSTRTFETVIGMQGASSTYSITGSFFCQQNDLTHVCAHACLRMAINSSPAHGLPKKLTNRQINDQLGIDHTDGTTPQGWPKRVGKYKEQMSEGLSLRQIRDVIESLNLNYQVANFRDRPGIDYDAFIYPLVDSRAPIILGIEGFSTAHVVSVVGRTHYEHGPMGARGPKGLWWISFFTLHQQCGVGGPLHHQR